MGSLLGKFWLNASSKPAKAPTQSQIDERRFPRLSLARFSDVYLQIESVDPEFTIDNVSNEGMAFRLGNDAGNLVPGPHSGHLHWASQMKRFALRFEILGLENDLARCRFVEPSDEILDFVHELRRREFRSLRLPALIPNLIDEEPPPWWYLRGIEEELYVFESEEGVSRFDLLISDFVLRYASSLGVKAFRVEEGALLELGGALPRDVLDKGINSVVNLGVMPRRHRNSVVTVLIKAGRGD